MDLNQFDDAKRYKLGIVLYFIIFFVAAGVIGAGFMPIYINLTGLDSELFIELYTSNTYLDQIGQMHNSVAVGIVKYNSLLNMIIYIVISCVIVYIYKIDFVRDFDLLYSSTPKDYNTLDERVFTFDKQKLLNFIKTLFKWTIIYFLINYACNFIILQLNNLLELGNSQNQEIIELSLKHSAFPMILSAAFLGPIVEEFIFRKSIFGIIDNKKIALLLSTGLFAVIHILSSLGLGYNPLELLVLTLPYLTGGLIFGFIYLKTNLNIYYVTLIHIFSNVLAIILVFNS